jgi:hypothetical protein
LVCPFIIASNNRIFFIISRLRCIYYIFLFASRFLLGSGHAQGINSFWLP